MQQASLDELAQFFPTAKWPIAVERKPTFFSIAGFPHYENVMSNMYKFFFSTGSPHGLGALCLYSLLDVVKEKQPLVWQEAWTNEVHAYRELPVEGGQRLDILLHNGLEEDTWEDANSLILIENKVYHKLNNDLKNYFESVKTKNPTERKTAIVLGFKKELLPSPWIFVSHDEWATAVERRLGSVIYQAEPRYLTLLLELIENIRTMTKNNESFNESFKFFLDNKAAISRAATLKSDVYHQIPHAIRKALSPSYLTDLRAGSKSESWVGIKHPTQQPLSYILYYGELFEMESDAPPSYAITLLADGWEESNMWRPKLMEKAEAIKAALIERKCEGARQGYVLTKVYEITPKDYSRIPELVADNLHNDWKPLEEYWLQPSSITLRNED